MDLEVLPLFSSPVGILILEEDFSSMANSIPRLNFIESGSYNFSYSDRRKILDDFPEVKEIMMSYFNLYKDEVLNLGPTDFAITTSWITQTGKGGYSHEHRHSNSLYSCVFYFDDGDGGQLEFSGNPSTSIFELNYGSNDNMYNTDSIEVKPRKNMLVIFPSNLEHRVLENTSDMYRYSLAFNLFPVGSLSDFDSGISLSVS